jgi:hypothetical protein
MLLVTIMIYSSAYFFYPLACSVVRTPEKKLFSIHAKNNTILAYYQVVKHFQFQPNL